MPAIAGTCFNNTVAAGAFFLGFSRQFLTHVHWRTTYLGYGDGAHGLQILGLLCVHLLDSRAGTEREKGSQAKGCDDHCAFHNLYSSLCFAAAGRCMSPGRGREFLSG